MNPTELHRTFSAMKAHGGGFASRLADAWMYADPDNRARIQASWPELIDAYGPGSPFYPTAVRL